MKKLFNADILDIFETDQGFVYACKETIEDGREAVAFFNYNFVADLFERIPVNSYIKYKFGDDGFILARELGNFVTCSLMRISKDENIAAYDNGTIKVFDNSGIITDSAKVEYNGKSATSATVCGSNLWLTVPESNAVIRYSLKHKRIEFRIGGENEKAFSYPCGLSFYDNNLFVCNSASYKIRTVSLESFSVRDYAIFNEPVYKYFRINGTEFVVLHSGLYSL